MGYYTSYSMSWDCTKSKTDWDEVANEIESRQKDDSDFFHGVTHLGESTESCKWYHHETEVSELSKLYPDVVFELSGEGEEHGDIWKKYFQNGKMQTCLAKITFAAFNKSKLEEVK